MTDKEHKTGKGYCGKILNVDLGTGTISYRELNDAFYRKYLSGVGLGAKVLWDNIKPGIDPLGPENILGFTNGLLTETGSLFSGRFTVVSKSPASGGWGDANCGGYFSPSLKRCGLDAVFFYGVSKDPVYLYVTDQSAELRDASGLWGRDTIETEIRLKEEHGRRAQVACIGPAGERLSYMAGIVNDRGRIAARGGLGAVMGSKRLKAVVTAGRKKVDVVDSEKIGEFRKAFRKKIDRFKFMEGSLGDWVLGLTGRLTRIGLVYPRQPADLWRLILSKFGTPSLTALSAESGDSPIKNWGGIGYRDFPLRQSQKIGAESVLKYQEKKYGCNSCPIRCGGIMQITEGPHMIKDMHKPEYETICAFGSLLLNDDLYSIFRLNDLVNRAGMDSISCGGTVAFAIECFENGILTMKDTDGLELHWGKADAIIKLTEMIINREGLGDILADGVKRAAERIGQGSKAFAVHCGGVEAPMHDPRFDPGFIFSYCCEPTPGRHTISSYQFLDLQHIEKKFSRAKKIPALTTRKNRYRYDDKGEGIAVNSLYKTLLDCAGICLFGTQIGGDIPICEWMNAATGWDLSNDDYLVIAERVHQLRHAFNIREAINPIRDFRPHQRLCGDPPLQKGPARKVTLDFDMLARSYYEAMHWDQDTGKTDIEHLRGLDLDEVIKTFYPGE
jgi:aldehyde:ferredoxin oxidoreductase